MKMKFLLASAFLFCFSSSLVMAGVASRPLSSLQEVENPAALAFGAAEYEISYTTETYSKTTSTTSVPYGFLFRMGDYYGKGIYSNATTGTSTTTSMQAIAGGMLSTLAYALEYDQSTTDTTTSSLSTAGLIWNFGGNYYLGYSQAQDNLTNNTSSYGVAYIDPKRLRIEWATQSTATASSTFIDIEAAWAPFILGYQIQTTTIGSSSNQAYRLHTAWESESGLTALVEISDEPDDSTFQSRLKYAIGYNF